MQTNEFCNWPLIEHHLHRINTKTNEPIYPMGNKLWKVNQFTQHKQGIHVLKPKKCFLARLTFSRHNSN